MKPNRLGFLSFLFLLSLPTWLAAQPSGQTSSMPSEGMGGTVQAHQWMTTRDETITSQKELDANPALMGRDELVALIGGYKEGGIDDDELRDFIEDRVILTRDLQAALAETCRTGGPISCYSNFLDKDSLYTFAKHVNGDTASRLIFNLMLATEKGERLTTILRRELCEGCCVHFPTLSYYLNLSGDIGMLSRYERCMLKSETARCQWNVLPNIIERLVCEDDTKIILVFFPPAFVPYMNEVFKVVDGAISPPELAWLVMEYAGARYAEFYKDGMDTTQEVIEWMRHRHSDTQVTTTQNTNWISRGIAAVLSYMGCFRAKSK